MSDSSRPSGPSHSAIWTCVAASGRRSAPNRTASAALPCPTPSAPLVGQLEPLAELGIARRVLPADQLDGARRAAGGLGEAGRGLGVTVKPLLRRAHARQPRDAARDPS